MTRDTAQAQTDVTQRKTKMRKAVTFDDWLRRDDKKYAVLQEVLVASDDESRTVVPLGLSLVFSRAFSFPLSRRPHRSMFFGGMVDLARRAAGAPTLTVAAHPYPERWGGC
ncbi:hypothetical protein ISCGN_024330 [Ixodes scapularis]